MSILCCFSLDMQQQAIVHTLTSRRMVDGPSFLSFNFPLCEYVEILEVQQLDKDEVAEIHDLRHPEKTRYLQGPTMARLEDPWEEIKPKKKCSVLDQDDYLIIRDTKGNRRVVQQAQVYEPQEFGEVTVKRAQSTQIPVNHYIIVNDDDPVKLIDGTDLVVTHIRGPKKWFPEPFQRLTLAPNGKDYFPCIEVTTSKAVHIQRRNGAVELIDTPGYYMPDVGENVVATVNRQVLLSNDFCILKAPDGSVAVKSGQNPNDRSFFLKPFENFLKFNCDEELFVLNTSTRHIPHNFVVRTTDNVMINIDVRISYTFNNVPLFASNPIDFYDYIRNHVQNSLLDRFARSELRAFLADFGKIAESTLASTRGYFENFGIYIEAILVLNYKCVNSRTQGLLHADIHTNVTKQNELRAMQNDVLIQEQANEVLRKQKDLEVQMCMKDNEVKLQEKVMSNTLRMREMDIEIVEEEKRSDLLEVRRANDVTEAEFEGRAKGHELNEYIRGIGESLTNAEKIAIYDRKCNLEQAKILYAKADKITLYPHGVDIKSFQTDNEEDAQIIRASYLSGIGLTHGFQKENVTAEFKSRI